MGAVRGAAMRLVVAFALLLLLPAAGHGAAWTTPTTIDNGGQRIEGAGVAVAPDGAATVVWVRTIAGRERVEARRIGPDGSPGPIQVLSDLVDEIAGDPLVAVAADGSALVAWASRDGALDAPKQPEVIRLGSLGQPIGPSQFLAPGANVAQLALEVAPGGAAIVAWTRLAPGVSDVQSVRLAPGATTGVVRDVSVPGTDGEWPTVLVRPDGTALIAWVAVTGGVDRRVQARVLDSAGVPGTASADISPTGVDAIQPRLARLGGGSSLVAWAPGFSPDRRLRFAVAPDNGSFGPAAAVPGSEDPTTAGAWLAPRAGGGLLIASTRQSGGVGQIVANRIDPSGTPGPPVLIAASPAAVKSLDVASSSGGHTAFVWSTPPPAGAIRAVMLPPAGDPSPPAIVDQGQSVAGDLPRVALAPGGDATAAWTIGLGSPIAVGIAHFDATPPSLSIAAPATATAGLSANFSASGTDRSAPVTFAWDFGDGAGAGGPVVSHTFTQAGVRVVTLTATDAAGNSAQAQAVVQVAPALVPQEPAPPPASPPEATTPRISALSVTPGRVVLGARRAQTTRLTRVRFRLSEPARVRVEFRRQAPGRRVGRSCVAPNRRLVARRAPRCARFVTAAVIARSARAGANVITITRLRVGARTLRPGIHRVEVVATNAAGNRSAPRTASLRVMAAPRR